jgi:hypothetical protein
VGIDPLQRLEDDLNDLSAESDRLLRAEEREVVGLFLAVHALQVSLAHLAERRGFGEDLWRNALAHHDVGKRAPAFVSPATEASGRTRMRVALDRGLVEAVSERFGNPPVNRSDLVELALLELLVHVGQAGWEGGAHDAPVSEKARLFDSDEDFLAALKDGTIAGSDGESQEHDH